MTKRINMRNSQTPRFGRWLVIIIAFLATVALCMALFGKDESDSGMKEESEHKIESGNPSENDASGQEDKQEIELQQQSEAEYEKWLAAVAIIGISIEYPDFQPRVIYTETATELNDRESSKGIYVIFESNGKDMAIYSVPLKEERTETGTIDISAMNLGFATFDLVDVESIDVVKCQTIPVEEVGKLISEVMQFSKYHH